MFVFFKALVRWIDEDSSCASRATLKDSSDHVNLQKPVEAFKEWKEWIARCIDIIEK